QASQRSHRGRLRRAAFAPDQHAADRRIDRVEHEGALHLLLADDRGERQGQLKGHRKSLARDLYAETSLRRLRYRSSSFAMISRMISFVPAPIGPSRASRQARWIGYSIM